MCKNNNKLNTFATATWYQFNRNNIQILLNLYVHFKYYISVNIYEHTQVT